MADRQLASCSYCQKTVSKNGIKCPNCENSYHPSCSDRVNKSKSEGNFLCCKINENSENEIFAPKNRDWFQELINLKNEIIKSKEEIIISKEQTIQCLFEKNKLLEERILHLSQNITYEMPKDGDNQMKEKSLVSVAAVLNEEQGENTYQLKTKIATKTVGEIKECPINPKIIKSSIKNAVENLNYKQKLNEIIDLEDNKEDENGKEENNNPWFVKKGRRYEKQEMGKSSKSLNRPKLIIGTNEELNFKAATKRAHFHLYKVDKSTTMEVTKNHLTANNFVDVECERMTSKYPASYGSFKVSINYDQKEKLKEHKLWPRDVCIDPFLVRLLNNGKKK